MHLLSKTAIQDDEYHSYQLASFNTRGLTLPDVTLTYERVETGNTITFKGIISPFVKRPSELELAMIAGYGGIHMGGRCVIEHNDEFEIVFNVVYTRRKTDAKFSENR